MLLSQTKLPAQSPGKIDSLRTVAAAAKVDSVKIKATYELGVVYRKSNPDSTKILGEWLLKKAKENKDAATEAYGYSLLALASNVLGDNIKAIDYYEQAAKLQINLPNKKDLGDTYHNIIYPLIKTHRYADAFEYETKSLNIYTEIKDSVRMAGCYAELGKLANSLDNPQLGIAYAKKGLDLKLQMKASPYIPLSRLGEIYSLSGKYDSAVYYMELALAEAEKLSNKRGIAVEKNNIAEILVKKGEYARAETLFKECLAFLESTKDQNNAPLALANLADLSLKTGNNTAALQYIKRALEIAEPLQNPSVLAGIYNLQADIFHKMGDFQNAYKAARKYEVMHDSTLAAEHKDEAAAIEAQFRTAENQKTIAEQNLDLEKQHSHNQMLTAFAIFALVAGAGIALFLREKRRRAELALQLKDAEASKLKELDTVKSAFFANISHEFRTPLTMLLGPLGEMEAGTFRGDARKYYGIMRRNASRLLQLVNQLLDLSRLESGKLSLNAQPGDLAHHLRAIAGSFQSLADQRQIAFVMDVPDQPIWVKFDADKLEKIVGNLLSNAFKFTPEEGTVVLGMRDEESGMRGGAGSSLIPNPSSRFMISISDTGIGISADQLPHIFERFYQVENTGADLQPGSGIGLALTKELVELHGGQISVESVDGKGTTFTVLFNFEEAAPQKIPAVSVAPAVEAVPPQSEISNRTSYILNQKPPTSQAPLILIAEDHPDVRSYVAERLAGHYQLLEAANGQEALDLALAQTPDLILTDLMMPVMDGVELTKRLKADVRTNHIPVVMLTAKGDRNDRIGGIETGAEAYLTKPFDAEELRATLSNLLAQRRILQEKFAKQIKLETPAEAIVSLDDKFLQQVLTAIENNLDDETFGVEQLAAAVAMSRSNLFRKIDALLGKSPVQLIRERRLLKAKHLLESGAGNSTEVAYMTGFQSLSYFAKCYQEMYGEAPGAVARRKSAI
ncbi:MAG: response regulator [Saprospiraceae bacterium]|nr:response regulator [Saprospiraceae bacterium]